MDAMFLSSLSLVIEVAIGLSAILALCALSTPGVRVLLYRGAFVVSALAPITLVMAGHVRPTLLTLSAATPHQPSVLKGTVEALGLGTAVQAHFEWWPFVLAAWLMGVAVVVLRTATAHAALSKRHTAGAELAKAQAILAAAVWQRLGMNQPVAIRVSEAISSPCVFGWRHPKMLLPSALREDALPAVLAHEFCHVRSGDTAWLVVERLACALHWFNPLIWICAGRHRRDAEFVCDDAATAIVNTREYAMALVEVARDAVRTLTPVALAMGSRGLEPRVHALISRKHRLRPPSTLTRGAVVLVTTAMLVLLGAAQIVSAAEFHEDARDPVDAVSLRPAEGDGFIFVDAPQRGNIDVGGTGACWDGGRCVFEHPLGSLVRIRSSIGARFGWAGCDNIQGEICEVRVARQPAHVSLRTAN